MLQAHEQPVDQLAGDFQGADADDDQEGRPGGRLSGGAAQPVERRQAPHLQAQQHGRRQDGQPDQVGRKGRDPRRRGARRTPACQTFRAAAKQPVERARAANGEPGDDHGEDQVDCRFPGLQVGQARDGRIEGLDNGRPGGAAAAFGGNSSGRKGGGNH
jgi:hypothetical protein